MTELLSAQRKAAWADVARRIAHEIKNPLTPIQLSAERLKRKYLKEIKQRPRDLHDLHRHDHPPGRRYRPDGRRVLVLRPHAGAGDEAGGSRRDLSQQAVFLQRTAHPRDRLRDAISPTRPVPLRCDGRQIGQALTNLAEERGRVDRGANRRGRRPTRRADSRLRVEPTRPSIAVAVEDNGQGLPQQGRERLTEPYVTTRPKGTGLGLAIVKKIMEDHHGELVLDDREGGGARVRLGLRHPQAQ